MGDFNGGFAGYETRAIAAARSSQVGRLRSGCQSEECWKKAE